MRYVPLYFALVSTSFFAFAGESAKEVSQNSENFKSFTGKITRNKVRMRLKPSLEAPILQELSQEDLVIVTGESDEFYAVKPPAEVKAYVFRTFVLDGVVEGNRVNVRLEPDTDAHVISQLNSGDQVVGTISPLNSKWLEISPPESTRFYICKEYVHAIGEPSLFTILTQRREDVDQILETSIIASQSELQKPYEEIRLEEAIINLNKIISQYSDFPSQVSKAKEQINAIQEALLQKKLAYLENKTFHLEREKNLFQTFSEMLAAAPSTKETALAEPHSNDPWVSVEQKLYDVWLAKNPGASLENYYADQQKNALHLSGVVEPYQRPIRNKPGDYILVSKTTKLPVAYLYSTRIDLSTKANQEVSIVALPRPNYDFAFPAYFVFSAD